MKTKTLEDYKKEEAKRVETHLRYRVKNSLLREKALKAGLSVSEAEIDAEIKRLESAKKSA